MKMLTNSLFGRLGIFPKLVFTFFITILPLYVISLQLNQMGASSVKREILTSMGTRAHFYLNSLETEFQRTLRLQRQFVVDDDMITLSAITPETSDYDLYETLQIQRRIKDKLLLMENSSSYIEQAKVYIPKLKQAFTSNAIESDLPDAFLQAFNPRERIPNPLPALRYEDGRLLLRTIPPEPSYLDKVPDFIIQAEISPFAVEQYLTRMTYRGDEGVMLLDDEGRWQLDNQHGYSISEPLAALIREQRHFGTSSGQLNAALADRKFLISYVHSSVLGATMAVFVPEQLILGPLQTYNTRLWWLSGISVIVVVLFSYWIYRLIHAPLKKLVSALRKMEKGDLSIYIHRRSQDEFRYLYTQFNSMVARIKALIRENYESQIVAQQLELKQLQSQINPHFLYNTYFMIHRMAESGDLDNVRAASKYMGHYFLYITRNASEEATLQAEIEHTLNYLEIQSLRFSRRVESVFSGIPEVCASILVPRLILQPLLENAYQHGMRSKIAGGLVALNVTERNGHVVLVIEDNGDDLADGDLQRLRRELAGSRTFRESTGMINVHRRLRMYFGEPYGLEVSRGQWGGLKVQIEFPIRRTETEKRRA